ncbi:MAG: hypothetical protein QME13_08710, partial [Thermoanaerobacteraceae bacterium]|nr:hypothetical protein [Thermoanaerobacteraceae bacterium]
RLRRVPGFQGSILRPVTGKAWDNKSLEHKTALREAAATSSGTGPTGGIRNPEEVIALDDPDFGKF